MPVPVITVVLTTPTIPGGVNLSPLLSQETNATLSSLIEDPTGTNDFTTGDISFKGYDQPGGSTVSGYFSSMLPTSADHTVFISMSLVPPGGVITQDIVFSGYVAPNTVQFEPRTGAFSFTVIGFARNLQTTPASTIQALNRTAPTATAAVAFGGYWPTKWILQQDASPLDTTIRITVNAGFSTKVCDFQGQDQIQIGGNEKFTVVSVQSDGANPPVYWVLGLNAAMQNKYTASSAVPITLLTPYIRNVSLQFVVTALFNAAGFTTQGYFGSAPLPFLSVPFASPVNTTGLPGVGAVTGISPVSFAANPQPIAVGTPGEVGA